MLLRSVAVAACLGCLLCTRVSLAQLPPAPAGDVEPSAEARRYFQIGVSQLQDPDGAQYEEAYKSFLRAYELSPSWKILGNLGLSALKLERFTDGIEAYERYLAAAGSQLDPTERQQIERDLEVMKASSGQVVLRVADGSSVTIEDTRKRSVGGPVVNAYKIAPNATLTLKVAAGQHTLTATGAGKRATYELEVHPGSNVEHTFTLESPKQSAATAPVTSSAASSASPEPTRDAEGSSLKTTGMIVAGAGALLLIGGGVTGFMGINKKDDLEKRCPENQCTYTSAEEKSSIEDDKQSLKTFGLATTVLLIGGGVATATGVTLFVLGGSSKERVSVSANAGLAGASLSARGVF